MPARAIPLPRQLPCSNRLAASWRPCDVNCIEEGERLLGPLKVRESRTGLDVLGAKAFPRYCRLKSSLVRERDTLPTQHVSLLTEGGREALEAVAGCELYRSFPQNTRAQPKDPPAGGKWLDQTSDNSVVSTGVADNEEHPRALHRQLLKVLEDFVRDEALLRRKYPP